MYFVSRKVTAVGVNKGLYCEVETGNITISAPIFTAGGVIISSDLDTETATTLLLGKSTANKVEIADTGVVPKI